jgi:ribosomal protein L9
MNYLLKSGKPAITGTKHVFVSPKIPVILLCNVPNVGLKGEIVETSRGFFRKHLFPNKLAVTGCLWENIDKYASKELLSNSSKIQRDTESATEKVTEPFDWINKLELEMTRSSKDISISKFDILTLLSETEQLDLMPSELMMTEDPITLTGVHRLHARLLFRGFTGNYDFSIRIRSTEEVLEDQRRKELEEEAKAKKKRSFKLQEPIKFDKDLQE